jgi:1,5-anhydro-D-fructose reductase (1,5-anhydro-D-mannitol-forming)
MTQRPVGEIELVTAAGRETVPYSAHNLYAQAVKCFVSAAYGEGEPAATGVDGVKSLAVAAAVKQAADTGRRVAVGYGI